MAIQYHVSQFQYYVSLFLNFELDSSAMLPGSENAPGLATGKQVIATVVVPPPPGFCDFCLTNA